jgi:hypothetical protein
MGTTSFVQIEINAVFTTTSGKMQFRSGVFDHFKGSKNLTAKFGPDSFTNVPDLDIFKLLHNMYYEKQSELTTDRTSPIEAGDKTLSLKKPMAMFLFFFNYHFWFIYLLFQRSITPMDSLMMGRIEEM